MAFYAPGSLTHSGLQANSGRSAVVSGLISARNVAYDRRAKLLVIKMSSTR